jgi:hypothetical protein
MIRDAIAKLYSSSAEDEYNLATESLIILTAESLTWIILYLITGNILLLQMDGSASQIVTLSNMVAILYPDLGT